MKVELFSVYDMAAERYMDPFPGPTIEFAIRGFREPCETEGHNFNKYPEDFALYHVGSFDPEMGVVIAQEAHKIAIASQFARTPSLLDDKELEA